VPLVKIATLLADCLADELHLVVAPFFVGVPDAPRVRLGRPPPVRCGSPDDPGQGASDSLVAVIGYERVSRLAQRPEAQTARLRDHGCMRIFTDHGAPGRGSIVPGGIPACTTCAKGPTSAPGVIKSALTAAHGRLCLSADTN
jgi:hypothetical protein